MAEKINILTDKRIPNESEEYRKKRNELLQLEYELRQKAEEVAQFRRELPLGGKLKEDYEFEFLWETNLYKKKFSELFEKGKDTLFIYNLMFAEGQESPCGMCTSILDAWEGQADHLRQKINFFVVCKQTPENIQKFCNERGWKKLGLMSSKNNTFGLDYHGEDPKTGFQQPVAHVFKKDSEGNIHHFWMSEMLYSNLGQNIQPRHVDMAWPLWNILDYTPEGRGQHWYPKVKYD